MPRVLLGDYANLFDYDKSGSGNPDQGLTVEGVDIGILVVLFLSAIVGLLYGLLNVLFSIAAWIMAAVTADQTQRLFISLAG